MRILDKTVRNSPIIWYVSYIGINTATILLVVISLTYIPQFKPFLLYLPTIAIFSWFGGFIVGLFTILLSIASIIIMIYYPVGRPLIHASPLPLEIVVFLFVSSFISYIIHIAQQQGKITDYQKRLRQSHQVIESLEKYYDSAEKEIQARDQFLAIASHELKTPVTSMLLQVQTAIHNIRNVSIANFSVATLLKMLEDTEQQSKRLSKMVNDLLDLSLITTGKIDLELEETNVSNIVTEVANRFIDRLSDKKQLNIEIKKPVIGFFDKLRIEQAVVNLISNAIKYGNNKPIIIEVSNTHDLAKITVTDKGIGIASDQQKKIFNRFERAVSPRDYKGLGVGLYITFQIVKAHKGKINLQSEPNKGSTFMLELPLRQQNN